MLQIKKHIIQQIIVNAQKDLPNETCGYLAGNDGVITDIYPLTNIDHSPEHFSFDPYEQFATVKDARNKGLDIIANYHSHPSTPARPSVEDIRLAFDSSIRYFIVSLADEIPDVKAFIIKDGKVENEPLEVIN